MKYYAVRIGREPGIYTDWFECCEQVMKYSGAVYAKFSSLEEAKAFLASDTIDYHEQAKDIILQDDFIAYVDGSYDKSTNRYGYGVYCIYKGKELTYSGIGEDEDGMCNVTGEIQAAMFAMRAAKLLGAQKVVIYHDYSGIANWCKGVWEAKKPSTKEYKRFYDTMVKGISVQFIKVKGHSGCRGNIIADGLARKALGLG